MWDIISLIPLLEMMALIGQKSRNFRTVILGVNYDFYTRSGRIKYNL